MVKAMNNDKAPGHDGFTMVFIQACWDVIKVDIMNVFQKFHTRGQSERSFTATFLALVMKKLGVVDIKDFCPISIVGGVYKIVAKALANRQKMVVEKIISKPWNAFMANFRFRSHS